TAPTRSRPPASVKRAPCSARTPTVVVPISAASPSSAAPSAAATRAARWSTAPARCWRRSSHRRPRRPPEGSRYPAKWCDRPSVNPPHRSTPAPARGSWASKYIPPTVSPLPPEAARRRRLVTRMLPLSVVAVVAFILGAVSGTPGSPGKDAAGRFVEAWGRKDFAAMYRELNDESRHRVSAKEFAKAYREAAETATLRPVSGASP